MELAVLADIHSNHVALEKCMEYALERGISDFLFLGDYLGEFAYPERTMDLLYLYDREYHCTFICGNKEEYWLKYRKREKDYWQEISSTTGMLYYSYSHVRERDFNFFEKLRLAQKLQYASLPTLIACHGSPFSTRSGMRPGNEESKRILEQIEVDYLLYGHSHVQGITEHQGKIALNPGSVGVGLEASGMAQFAILRGEEGGWKEEFISLDYDRQQALEEMREAGFYERAPYWSLLTEKLILNQLPEGICHANILEEVMRLCQEETGVCNWPDIPEKFWEKALGNFGIR